MASALMSSICFPRSIRFRMISQKISRKVQDTLWMAQGCMNFLKNSMKNPSLSMTSSLLVNHIIQVRKQPGNMSKKKITSLMRSSILRILIPIILPGQSSSRKDSISWNSRMVFLGHRMKTMKIAGIPWFWKTMTIQEA